MTRVYKCDYCDQFFVSEVEVEEHEKKCGRNPKNRIESKLLFRLSMIFHSLPTITACALHEVAQNELDYLHQEAERASNNNCPFMIKEQQQKMLSAISAARSVTQKHKGRDSSTYKDVINENPELFRAMVDTLKRAAWNE